MTTTHNQRSHNSATMQDFMKLTNYRINEGNEYGWPCFGSNPFILESWNGQQNGYSFTVVYDTIDNYIYQLSACDFKNSVAFQWTDPAYVGAYKDECMARKEYPAYAWDTVQYQEIIQVSAFFVLAEEIIERHLGEDSISQNVSYVVEDIPKELLYQIRAIAKERGITPNRLISETLQTIWIDIPNAP